MRINQICSVVVIVGSLVGSMAQTALAAPKGEYNLDGKCVAIHGKYATIQTRHDIWKVSKVFYNTDDSKVKLKVGKWYCVWLNGRGTKSNRDDVITDFWKEAK